MINNNNNKGNIYLFNNAHLFVILVLKIFVLKKTQWLSDGNWSQISHVSALGCAISLLTATYTLECYTITATYTLVCYTITATYTLEWQFEEGWRQNAP